jgi:hypothetical protein
METSSYRDSPKRRKHEEKEDDRSLKLPQPLDQQLNTIPQDQSTVTLATSNHRLEDEMISKVKAMGEDASKKLLDSNNNIREKYGGDNWDVDVDAESVLLQLLATHDEVQSMEDEYQLNRDTMEQKEVIVRCESGDSIRVQHLGHGVFAQHLTRGIVDDENKRFPVLLTRCESRDAARASITSVLTYPNNGAHRYTVLTGNPGIGKSFGILMHTLELLLHARAAVLVVLGKRERSLLFVPHTHGTSWTVVGAMLDEFQAVRGISNLLMLVDPNEDGEPKRGGDCHIIKFASTNAERHFRNIDKYGNLLFTSMPTEEELEAMTGLLWKDDISPSPGVQYSTLDEKCQEVVRRSQLVGCAPRYVFNYENFKTRLLSVKKCIRLHVLRQDAQTALEDIESLSLISSQDGTISGRLFYVMSNAAVGDSWTARKLCYLEWNSLALVQAYRSVDRKLDFARICSSGSAFGDVFERIVGQLLCRVDVINESYNSRLRKREFVEVSDIARTFERIKNLSGEEGLVIKPGAENFPVIDFAISWDCLFNAKSSDSMQFKTSLPAAMRLLRELDIIDENDKSRGKRINLVFVHRNVVDPAKCSHQFVRGQSRKTEEISGDEIFTQNIALAEQCINVKFLSHGELLKECIVNLEEDVRQLLECYGEDLD